MADYPINTALGKTATPRSMPELRICDRLAAAGQLGMVKTVPEGMPQAAMSPIYP